MNPFFFSGYSIMSSVQSSYAQIGSREKYLLVVAAGSIYPLAAPNLPYLATLDQWNAAPGGNSTLSVGTLYRDLGRTLTVYDLATGLHLAKLAWVQLVSGMDDEGASNSYGYLLTWDDSADALGMGVVSVARVG